jgi:hypothetical protein
MALPCMRWTSTGADLISTKARDGAELRGINEALEPRRTEEHVYIYLPPGMPRRHPAGRRTVPRHRWPPGADPRPGDGERRQHGRRYLPLGKAQHDRRVGRRGRSWKPAW